MSSAEVGKIKLPIVKNLNKYVKELSTLPLFVPSRYTREVDHGQIFPKTQKIYDLNIIQRVFVTFDYAVSSVVSSLYSTFMVGIILMSVVVYIITTDNSVKFTPDTCDYPACNNDPVLCPGTMVCEPIDKDILDHLELFCLSVFVMDFGVRVMLCPFMPGRLLAIMPHNWDQVTNVTGELEDPEYAPLQKILLYLTKAMNLVDLVAIITGFLAYYSTNETGSGKGLAIARVLRLVRVFRVFKVAGMSKGVPLFIGTIKRSMSAVRVMFFFSLLAVIVVGSIMYYVESGDFEVTTDHPEGAYLRWDYVRNQKEISPFGSILYSMYWAVVTTTTVGYGDFYPTTGFGRFVACLYMYFGIIMLALPISVVGTNFQREYELHYPDYIERELKRQKQRAALGVAPVPNSNSTTTANPMQEWKCRKDSDAIELPKMTANHSLNPSRNDSEYDDPNKLDGKISSMDDKLNFLINEIRELRSELAQAKANNNHDEIIRGDSY